MSGVPVKSVKKALDLLSILLFEGFENGLELSVLAKKMSMPANSARNLLKSMITCDFVEQNQAGRYIPGSKCRQIGILNQLRGERQGKILEICLGELSRQVNESVVYTILADGKRLPVARSDPNQFIRVDSGENGSTNFYDLPTARILAVYASKDELTKIESHYGKFPSEWDGFSGKKKFSEVAAQIRSDGFSGIYPDSRSTAAIACPVFNSKGEFLGALGCHAPIFRCPPEKYQQIIITLKEYAKQLGKELDNSTS